MTDEVWLEPLRQWRLTLRRYSRSAGNDLCPEMLGRFSYHNAHTPLKEVSTEELTTVPDATSATYDGLWPLACACGYVFRDSDYLQIAQARLYRRSDTGVMVTGKEAPGLPVRLEGALGVPR